jgi:hypothetical protein
LDAFAKNRISVTPQGGGSRELWVWKFRTFYFAPNLSLVSKQFRDEILAVEAETGFQDNTRTPFHSLLESVFESLLSPEIVRFEFEYLREELLQWYSLGKPLTLWPSSNHVVAIACNGRHSLPLGGGIEFWIVMQHVSRHFKNLEEDRPQEQIIL